MQHNRPAGGRTADRKSKIANRTLRIAKARSSAYVRSSSERGGRAARSRERFQIQISEWAPKLFRSSQPFRERLKEFANGRDLAVLRYEFEVGAVDRGSAGIF